ncbi:MAG: protein kinase [Candidatus Moeniiplasma glomeromycotorum]|nr:protein kinase [Candidatus Moeniiplasma glomeromycotorum]
MPCYGLSKDSQTGDYLMVMEYIPEGNLRHYLSNKNQELSLEDKLGQLAKIAQGLKDIHQKNLVHCDFHSGNILKGVEKTACLITDLGLCKPVDEASQENKIFGVMPYMAPEVLRSQPYTQASDIYSFGIVTSEILTGLPPYYDQEHNISLAVQICLGLRPKFQIKIPELLEDLIRKCWDPDPTKRPTANELEKILRSWEKGDGEFMWQIQEAKKHNETLSNVVKFPDYQKKMHSGAVYTSRLLSTKEISEILQEKISEQFRSSLVSIDSLKSNLCNKTSELSKQLIIVDELLEKNKTKRQSSSGSKKTLELINQFLEKSRELTKELEKILTNNPSISEKGKETLKVLKDKLKAKDNAYQELKEQSKQEWNEEKEKKISLLEQKIKELKEKIVQAYLQFAPEKELLQKLIISHLNFANAKERELEEINKYRKEFNRLYEELEKKKLDKKLIQEVEITLKDCEKLVEWEVELEKKLNSKQLLLEEKNQVPQITIYNDDNKFITYHNKFTQELTSTEKNTVKPIVKKFISRGGYGEVYYGEWKSQEVAVKKLYLSNTSKSDLKDIQKEISILKNLRNRYIIQYYDTYSDNQELLIIMDYAENGTLTKFINDNKNKEHNWELNVKLIEQIVKGLAYIHHEGIIHRDLKSMNILLTKNNDVKIADFGLSKTKIISSSNSRHSGVIGTLRWMASELLKDGKYSEQSDIYALGMVIWEIVAKCTKPFEHDDDNLVQFHFIVNSRKEDIPSDTLKDIRYIIEQCWKDNPSERISLANILEIIKEHNCLLEYPDFPESQSIQEISNQFSSLSSTDSFNPFYPKNNIVEFDNKIENLITGTKRQLSLETQVKTNQGDSKSIKLGEEITTEPTDIDNYDWQSINPNFTEELIQSWTNLGFSPSQTRDWINIGLSPHDHHFAAWLRDELYLEPLEVLNNMNSENNYQEADLREQFQEYRQTELQNQLQLAYSKKSGQIAWENWETLEGLENWIKELEQKISQLEIQQQQTYQERSPAYLESKIELPPK